MQPLVSVIVVIFQDCGELAHLVQNLSSFRSPEVELIVIDGGSQDGSVDLLVEKSADIDYWLSEPDAGIYDAMNKGISAARGQYVLHINAGDRLMAIPFVQLRELSSREVDIVCCRVLEDEGHLYVPRNDWLLRLDNTWHHQGTFFRRAAHLEYDASYSVFGDFDHNQRLCKAGRSVAMLDAIVAHHETTGASRDKRARHEIFRSIRTNFGWVYLLPAHLRFELLRLRRLILPDHPKR